MIPGGMEVLTGRRPSPPTPALRRPAPPCPARPRDTQAAPCSGLPWRWMRALNRHAAVTVKCERSSKQAGMMYNLLSQCRRYQSTELMEKQKSTQRDSLRENRCRINAEVDRVVGWTGITWGVYGVKDKDLCPYFPAKRLVSRAEDESGRHKTQY